MSLLVKIINFCFTEMWGPCSCGGDGIPRHRYRFHKHESKHWSCTKNVFGTNLLFLRWSSLHEIRNRLRNVGIVGKSILVLDLYSSFTQNRYFVRATVLLTFWKISNFRKSVLCTYFILDLLNRTYCVSLHHKIHINHLNNTRFIRVFRYSKKKSSLPSVKKLTKYFSTIV